MQEKFRRLFRLNYHATLSKAWPFMDEFSWRPYLSGTLFFANMPFAKPQEATLLAAIYKLAAEYIDKAVNV